MAISPREELVLESIIVFGRFKNGWVWAETTPDGSTPIDSGHKAFDSVDIALLDFFEDRHIDPTRPVEAEDAHYSKLIPSGEDEVHMRKYKYGAPDPIQAVV